MNVKNIELRSMARGVLVPGPKRKPASGPAVPATTWPAIVGHILVRERERRRMDQADVAQTVGLSQSTYSRIERGKSALTIEQLNAASATLKTSSVKIFQQAEAVMEHARKRGVHVTLKRGLSSNGDFLQIDDRALRALALDVLR